MLYRLLSVLLLMASSASAENDVFASSSLAATEGHASSIVAGHVSAITGEFLLHDVDLTLPGLSPLRLQRTYSSDNPYGLYLCKGWNFVEPTSLYYSQTEAKGIATAILTTPHGARAKFERYLHSKPKGRTQFDFTPVKGYTNCGSGRISGQTNIRNNALYLNNQDKKNDCSGEYVYDAYGRPTVYHYDQDERLNQVVHYNGPDVHHIDAYFFEGKGSSQEGNLIAHYLRDPSHNTIKGKVYCYDSKGNVAGATVFSSVTGKNDTPITLRSDL